MKKSSNKYKFYFIVLAIGVAVLFVLDVLLGSVSIPFSIFIDLFQGNEIEPSLRIIIVESRIPKATTAILCGSSLALSGLLMQTLFRNPLAGPYILGISSGAGLGVALLVMGAGVFGLAISSTISISIAALIGAVAILLILFAVSIRIKLKSYDHNLVDKSSEKIVRAVKTTGAVVSGPIPLPTVKEKFTVLKSPHVNKKAREQFQLCTYKRLVDIYSNSAKTVDALMKLELPSGVDVEIKV